MPDIVLQAKLNNYPFDYNVPASGTVLLTDGIAIVSGAKHMELAKKFYEFVTSEESLVSSGERILPHPRAERHSKREAAILDHLNPINIDACRLGFDLPA